VKRWQQLAIAIPGLAAAYVLAQHPGMLPLTGEFDTTGRTAVDPPKDEPRNTHFRIHLTGQAARTLFDQMPVEATPESCDRRPGWQEKRIGGMLCSTDGRAYDCFLAINVEQQTVEGGWAC
jgi:hypothetical protein